MYTYAVATADSSGHHSSLSHSITIRTLASGSSNNYTVLSTDDPATIYGILDNAGCGDTLKIGAGTYSAENGHGAMIFIKDKRCTSKAPYIIQVADPNNPPTFDYTGHPLDGQVAPVPNHWTPWESDFSRAAWQIHNSSYVILDGVRIKGAYGRASDAIAGVRFLQTDHFTIRHSILEKNWDGVEGNGTDTVIEYDTFLANGYPGEDQQHQFYDTKVTISPPVITTSNDDGCDLCGQNLHTRSWHSYIYGNWFQGGSDYEWDMMTPATDYPVPSDGTMTQKFYNNVVVSSPHPRNTTEVFTFFADGAGLPTGKMKLDAEWNTFWIRGQSWIGNSYSLFQVRTISMARIELAK